jgi:hypothetical protein
LTVEPIDIIEVQQLCAIFHSTVEPMIFQELTNDQRRETVNSMQRYAVWRKAREDSVGYRGSMVWKVKKGAEYLVRSYYDDPATIRRQKSLGPRSPETEATKDAFDKGRERLRERRLAIQSQLRSQAAVNRAIGLGRVPLLGANIIRAFDDAGLLGKGIRIIGTYALYAYEAAAGVFLSPELTTTGDIDLMFDARRKVRFAAGHAISERSVMAILQKVDRSFERARQTFRAENRDGYLVDFIKPMPDPPWANVPEQLNATEPNDLVAASIEGLNWLEESPDLTSVAIDDRGMPFTIITPDPRVFAAHKFWLSKRLDRGATKRARDAAQAAAAGRLVAEYLLHLPYEHKEVAALPLPVFESARPLFAPVSAGGADVP